MKHLIHTGLIIILIIQIAHAQSFDTYMNPVIPGDHLVNGYYSNDGRDWKKNDGDFLINIASINTYSDYVTFTKTRLGLYVQGSEAFFDLFIYRDVYSPVLAECLVNQIGTSPTTRKDGIYRLDCIYNNDRVLYAVVEFGNNNYLKASKGIEIIASSGSSGGIVEMWLDSVNTGTKIADCNITNNGDWDTFDTFVNTVSNIEGSHNIYLLLKDLKSKDFFL